MTAQMSLISWREKLIAQNINTLSTFGHNFGKYKPIVNILSRTDDWRNFPHGNYVLLHYLMELEKLKNGKLLPSLSEVQNKASFIFLLS